MTYPRTILITNGTFVWKNLPPKKFFSSRQKEADDKEEEINTKHDANIHVRKGHFFNKVNKTKDPGIQHLSVPYGGIMNFM